MSGRDKGVVSDEDMGGKGQTGMGQREDEG